MKTGPRNEKHEINDGIQAMMPYFHVAIDGEDVEEEIKKKKTKQQLQKNSPRYNLYLSLNYRQ